jgi:hypothetical protein
MGTAGRGAVAALLVCGLALPAAGAAAPLDPPANIPLPRLPAACGGDPRGASCEQATIGALDAARAKLGLGPYLLPTGFVSLSPARQWLVLSDLDRLSYSLPPISGLSLTLDAVARQGARANEDPDPLALLHDIHTVQPLGYASNWAGGQANALLAYYGWMYDDGYGGPNLDCTSPTASGCWGHREDVLSFRQGQIAMGAAVVRDARSYALTIVDTSAPYFHIAYTWAQAQARGAGRRPHG